MLPFLLAPFGLMHGCFYLHPVMYKVKVRGEKHEDKRKVVDVGRKSDATHPTICTPSELSVIRQKLMSIL